MNYFIPLEPSNTYHVFNCAVGNERLFRNDENYNYFLKKFKEYISPVANVFSYALIPNHFHFLLEIKDKVELYNHYKQIEISKGKTTYSNEKELVYEDFIMQQFSNFFNSYAKSYNKRFNRKGALFIDYLRRTLISEEIYLRNCVLYIHQNPIHHNCSANLENWKYSSYLSFLSAKPSMLDREEVVSWFGDLENFVYLHTFKSINFTQPGL
jgi:putative transposase